MKQSVFLLLIAIIILIVSCKKSLQDEKNDPVDLIANAKNYFESSVASQKPAYSNPRFSSTRIINWNGAKVIDFAKMKVVVARVQYMQPYYTRSSVDEERFYSGNNITWLCMYKDSTGSYHTEQVALFPDSTYTNNEKFSGLISVDSWNGNALKKYIINKNNSILQWTGNSPLSKQTARTENGTKENLVSVSITETCYTIDEYVYSVDDPDNGVYNEEPAGCSYSISSDNEGGGDISGADYGGLSGGGGAAGGISPASSFTVLNGNNVIGNIVDYNKCFTNIAGNGNVFTVTVCVDQPEPGTREPWSVSGSGAAGSSFGSNPADVGHTFLVFTQKTGSGTITRNIGFYPTSSVNPWAPAAQGQLNNDAGHDYNISLTVSVTNSQFFNMLNFVSQGNDAGYQYNLNSNNCTSFALHTLSSGNVILPSTVGSWLNGSGNDPGDLGQDIQAMNLSPNMTRSTSESSHPNTGNCN